MAYRCKLNSGTECDGCMTCQERAKVHTCAWCDGEIYEGDDYYDIEDTIGCEDCVKGFMRTAGEES